MIASTWEQHCAEYQPGKYSRDVTEHGLKRDCNLVQLLFAHALLHVADTRELTTAGSCYGAAA